MTDIIELHPYLPTVGDLTGIEERAADIPDSEIKLGLIVTGVFFVLFLGWAAFAPMDSAAYAKGQLVVAGQRQTVQHRDGGVVQAIRVKEGQKVTRGQVLIELAGAEVRAQEAALAAQVISLKAQAARLQAELTGALTIAWPAEFTATTSLSAAEIEKAKAAQLAEFRTRRSVLGAQTSVLGQQTTQAVESASGFSRQMDSMVEQERLLEQELESLREVAAKGFVSMNRIRALERAKAELQGRRGQYQASVAQSGAVAGENRLRQIEAQKTYRERSSAELRDVEFSLSELLPKHDAAKDQLLRLQIRAPKSGTVVGLSIFTIGGVVSPGQRVLDVVPEKALLVVEARVSVADADDLTVGQFAQVRFEGLHDRGLPILSGRVTRLSADSFVDEKSGESYYTAEIVVGPKDLNIIKDVRGRDFALRAGAPVQVLVPIKKRTALQYAFEPLTEAMWRSFRER